MVTPALPSIRTTFEAAPTPAPQIGEDVVYIAGPYRVAPGDSDAQTIDGPYRTTTALAAGAPGGDGIVHDAAAAILSQINVPVYTVGTLVATGDTIPTEAQTVAALAKIAAASPAAVPTLILAPGQTAGASGNATAPSAVITTAVNGLAALAAQYGAIAVADAPKDTVGNAEAWAANNARDRVWCVGNYPERGGADIAPSGPAVGALALRTHQRSRAATVNLAPVAHIDDLHWPIGHTPRVQAGTDESKLVSAYISPIVASRGGYVVVGGLSQKCRRRCSPQSRRTACGRPCRAYHRGDGRAVSVGGRAGLAA